MAKERNINVDILKFLAVFIIINSHADICYPRYSFLATGGAIGDAIFLFCSGFTLWHSTNSDFFNYYKRRINRIYPSVFASLLFAIILGKQSLATLTIERCLGDSFVIAIMVYYILLFFLHKYLSAKIGWFFIPLTIVILAVYYFFPYKYETGIKGIYGISTPFRWIPYFGFMLMGTWMAQRKANTIIARHLFLDILSLLSCLIFFYGLQFIAKVYPPVAPFQIATLPFLFGVIYFLYQICGSPFAKRIYESKYGNAIILSIGGLCLESYLIQLYLISDKFNFLFPLNLVIMVAIILLASYCCRCMARFFSQTFRTEDYEWRKIFSLR